ncbi:MAG: hypothetical protein ABW123_27980 [Cystobacter sp.]
MLQFWNAQTYFTTEEGVETSYQVYQDDTQTNIFYIIPTRPTIAINQQDRLAFMFRKYRRPVDSKRADGKKGGGYVIFDVVLKVPDSSKKDILQQLRAANPKITHLELAAIPFTTGKVKLNIKATDKSGFVETLSGLGKPAQDGNYTASFSAELSQEGATFFEQALNADMSGGALQVFYSLTTWARSSDTTVTITFNRDNALKYHREIFRDVGSYSPGVTWREGKEQEHIQQTLRDNEAYDIKIVWNEGNYTPEQKTTLNKWATDTLGEAIKRQQPVLQWIKDSENSTKGKQIQDFDFSLTSNFSQTFSENFALRLDLHPQGMLPNVGSMKDSKGKPYQWKDYYKEVDLDDEWFKTLNLGVSTDMDFDTLPVKRVTVDLDYHGSKKTLTFAKGDSTRKEWSPYLVQGDHAYTYKYTLTFTNGTMHESEPMKATTKELVVGQGLEGLLAVGVSTYGVDDPIKQVLVKLTVVDEQTSRKGPSIQLVLTGKDPGKDIHLPVGKDFKPPYFYEYAPEYMLADGKRLQPPPTVTRDEQLLVLSPFTGTRNVQVSAALNDGEEAFVDLSYTEGSGYGRATQLHIQSADKSTKWTLGVIDRDAGVLTYSATVVRKDGSTQQLERKTTRDNYIRIQADKQPTETSFTVSVYPDDIQWDHLRRVTLSLQYRDPQGQTSQLKSLRLTKDSQSETYTFKYTDGPARYEWQATYEVEKDGKRSTHKTDWTTHQADYLDIPAFESATIQGS